MSTGIVGFLAAKSNTTSAVFGPTPGSCKSSFLACSKGNEKICVRSPLCFSLSIFEISLITFDLFRYNPAVLRFASISLISAFARISGVIRNLFERLSKARVVFLSLVFCEMMVMINVVNASRVAAVHFGLGNVLCSISRIFSALLISTVRAPMVLKMINSEYVNLLIIDGVRMMERARVVKDEIVEQNTRFLAVFVEAKNSIIVLLSEREDKLGTLAIAVPKPKDFLGPQSSSVLLGDKNSVSARLFAEQLASLREKIALVSVYLETVDEGRAQSAFKQLMEKVTHREQEKEKLTA